MRFIGIFGAVCLEVKLYLSVDSFFFVFRSREVLSIVRLQALVSVTQLGGSISQFDG